MLAHAHTNMQCAHKEYVNTCVGILGSGDGKLTKKEMLAYAHTTMCCRTRKQYVNTSIGKRGSGDGKLTKKEMLAYVEEEEERNKKDFPSHEAQEVNVCVCVCGVLCVYVCECVYM